MARTDFWTENALAILLNDDLVDFARRYSLKGWGEGGLRAVSTLANLSTVDLRGGAVCVLIFSSECDFLLSARVAGFYG